MSVRRSAYPAWSSVAAIMSWRGVSQRVAFFLFVGLSLATLALSKAQPDTLSAVRMRTMDAIAPVLDAVARPIAAFERMTMDARDFMQTRADNTRLREENAHLASWQNAVVTLQKENDDLRSLLRFKAEPSLAYISARVIADTGGAYARGLIVTAGKTDGVREGMAAMTGDGLIGRVVEAGEWSSRVILATDLNSRIPVTVVESGDRAIMAGDNSSTPKLLFLPRDAVLSEGMHVVTSGHGGIFPPGLPIGLLRNDLHGVISVVPAADLGRVNYVRLVDFDLKGGQFNTVDTHMRRDMTKK